MEHGASPEEYDDHASDAEGSGIEDQDVKQELDTSPNGAGDGVGLAMNVGARRSNAMASSRVPIAQSTATTAHTINLPIGGETQHPNTWKT
ncbi:hypothetical protein KC322_g22912 [Hortaea werneckii]|nr:hypothetical protein KC322_g22912 [Hortaea werneckii]